MYQDIADANAIIVGSPIYMFDISAQSKTWMDRLYPFIDMSHHPLYLNKKIVTIYSQGNPSPIAFEPQMERINKVFNMFGWKEIDRLNLTHKSPHVVPAELTVDEMEKASKIIEHVIG